MSNINRIILESKLATLYKPTKSEVVQSKIRDLIKDEYDAIDAYNQQIAYFRDGENKDLRIVKILEDIAKEEKIHVEELNHILEIYDADYNDAKNKASQELKK